MSAGYRSVAYFVNWAIYGRDHHAYQLPADRLTHVLYAFADIKPDTGEVFLTDAWADTDKHYPSDSWNDTGTNAYGCAKQLFLQKKKHRHLKVLLSIGGWTYSKNFAGMAATEAGRRTFAESAVKILADLGFDGLDIDWEYPKDATEGANFLLLLQATRAALNAYASRTSTDASSLLLSACFSSNFTNIAPLPLPDIASALDFLFLMAYDYAGSWDTIAGHQANIFPSTANPAMTPFATSAAVDEYLRRGVPANKLVLGMPLYGRAFGATLGPGQPFSGTGPPADMKRSWEQGVWDYKALPRENETEQYDAEAGASWSFGGDGPGMVSYDTAQAAGRKAAWICERGLGGGGWWESSGDRTDERGLIKTVTDIIGGSDLSGLEKTANTITYVESKYDNLRAGFPNE